MSESAPNPVPPVTPSAGDPSQANPVNPVSPLEGGNPLPAHTSIPPGTPPAVPPDEKNPQEKEVSLVNPLDDPQDKASEPDFEVTPEKLMFPQGFEVVPEAVNEFTAFVKEQKLNVDQVNGVIDWYGKFAQKQAAAARETEAQNIRTYNDSIAAIPQEDLQYARQAVEKFAASPEDKAFLKKAFVAPAVLKILASAGRATAEHAFIQSPTQGKADNPLAKMYNHSIQQGG